MDFTEVYKLLDENKEIIAKLKHNGVDILTIKKIENLMVQNTIVFLHTSYQENVINAIMKKVKYHSNNSKEIVKFIQTKIRKINLEIENLENVLDNFDIGYKSKFKNQLKNNDEEVRIYSSILRGRINVAHDQGNNLQIGSLNEIETMHNQSKHVLEKFENSLW